MPQLMALQGPAPIAPLRTDGERCMHALKSASCCLTLPRWLQVVNGALFIPAGVYRITKALDMRKSVVLRGAGKNLTTIYIPVSLTDVYGNTWSEVRLGLLPLLHAKVLRVLLVDRCGAMRRPTTASLTHGRAHAKRQPMRHLLLLPAGMC